MRNTDIRFPLSNETSNNIRYPIQFIPLHNQNQNIYYQTPMGLHISNQITNGSHIKNDVLYPPIYQIGHQQMMLNGNPHLIISVPCASVNMSDNNMKSKASEDSNMSLSTISPNSLVSPTNKTAINYSLSKWNEIYPFYEAVDDSRPSAGQLLNGRFFTQRSAGKDIYMVFDSKSDYINNFVNYYFSNKNFSTDEKLFNLMDNSGNVSLCDLVKFPRLAQIDTTIEDIKEALKFNSFVSIVNLRNDMKGIRRSDGWFPTQLIDESQMSAKPQWSAPPGDLGSSFKKPGSACVLTTRLEPPALPAAQNPPDPGAPSQTDMKPQLDPTIPNRSLIYFNNAALHQQLYASPYFPGLHPAAYQGLQSNGSALVTAGRPPHLIVNTQPHYPGGRFVPQSQPLQLRPVWPGHTLTDSNRNHIVYSSGGDARHTIGAGGNHPADQKQCPY